MPDYIIEALIRTSIIITILSIVILIISKFVTKYIGYRWRKIAWLIMLVCAIIPWGINPISLSEKTTQLYSQEERKINDVENYSQSKKNIEDNKQKEHNQVVFETKAIKEKSDAIFLKMPVMERIRDTVFENSMFFVIFWFLGMYISLNIIILKEKRLKKLLFDTSFKIEDGNTFNLIESIKQEIGYQRKLDVFYCTEICSPIIYGIISPKLYFPVDMDFNDSKINNIIRHEMIHLKSKDILYKKIMNCVMILYWFNPFIYIVKNKALEDIEYVCDSRVVNGLEKKQIGIYCRTILDTVPVKGNYMISFNNSKMKIKKRIDNCFLENEKVSDKKLYALLGGGMIVVTLAVCIITGAFVHKNTKNNKMSNRFAEIVETTQNEQDTEQDETTAVALKLSQRALHYDTGVSISKEKSEALKKMWLDDLNESSRKIVKDKIFNVHSYIECELVEDFKGDCSKDSEVWNNIDDNPKDNVISGYTIPDMISDLERVSTIINKESFSERINHIVGELQQLKKTHDIELFYKIHQETHDLSYWAINYPLEDLKIAPADWHGIYVYFGTLNDVDLK